MQELAKKVSIRYIAVLGFQRDGAKHQIHPTGGVSIRYIAVLGFQPPGWKSRKAQTVQFPSAISRDLVSNVYQLLKLVDSMARSFHPLYRGTWFPTALSRPAMFGTIGFPSAISRYLVSNLMWLAGAPPAPCCFHPLYRGTWFPTRAKHRPIVSL